MEPISNKTPPSPASSSSSSSNVSPSSAKLSGRSVDKSNLSGVAVSAIALQTLTAYSSQASALSSSFSPAASVSEEDVQDEEELKARRVISRSQLNPKSHSVGQAGEELEAKSEEEVEFEEEAEFEEFQKATARSNEGEEQIEVQESKEEAAAGHKRKARREERDEKLAGDPPERQKIRRVKEPESGAVESVFNYRNRDWNPKRITVTKAKEGVEGAWFYTAAGGDAVIKGQLKAQDQLMGSALLQSIGRTPTPALRIVSRSSPEGQQISRIGDPYGLNRRNPEEYIVMDRVMGKSYAELGEEGEDIDLVSDNLEAMGELAVYDLVLQNVDRFDLTGSSFNGGNFMFEDGSLYAIDTDCPTKVDDDKVGKARLALSEIAQGREKPYVDNLIVKLAENLPFDAPQGSFSKDKGKVAEGMKQAVETLKATEIEQLEKDFVDACRKEGGNVSALPAHVKELIEVIKKASVKS